MLFPTCTGFVPLLVTARSQEMPTSVTTVVLLLADVGSVVVAVTDEFAVIVLAVTVEGTFRTITMLAESVDASDGTLQVIVPDDPTAGVVQVHPAGGEIDWNVVFVGVASVNTTAEDAAGPLFVMVWVYVMLFPAKTADGVAEVTRARSACVLAATTSVAVAELAPNA